MTLYYLIYKKERKCKMSCYCSQEKQNEMSAGEEDLLKLREALEAEMNKLKTDSTTLSNLRGEHSRLKVCC